MSCCLVRLILEFNYFSYTEVRQTDLTEHRESRKYLGKSLFCFVAFDNVVAKTFAKTAVASMGARLFDRADTQGK